MGTDAILQIALAALPLINTGIPLFIAWLESLKAAQVQAGEWTDAQEFAFRAAIMAKMQDPAYQPDPK